jgi:pimeloyl-ACP methyl ester carboxylesterase
MQFIAQWFVNRGDTTPRATLLQHVGAWLGEITAAVRVFNWWQPFFHRAIPDGVQPDTRRGVVLVHGFFCNRAFWTPWLRHLRAQGRVYVAVDLEPAYCSIDAYTSIIDAAVARVTQLTGQPPLVVAHSMGGLAVRAWLRAHDAADRVYKVVTLGTPHHGTWVARFSATRNGAQMRLDSGWIKALAQSESSHMPPKFVCFFSNCDNIVFPVASARLIGADNRHEPAKGHVELMFSERVMRETWALLDETIPNANNEHAIG